MMHQVLFDLYLYLLSKIEEYSQFTFNVFDFASIKFFDSRQFLPSYENKHAKNYKHFILTKFDIREIQNIFNGKH